MARRTVGGGRMGAVERGLSEWAIKCTARQLLYTHPWPVEKRAAASMVRGMTFHARLAEPLGVSSLHVRLTADELRRCRSCSSRPPHLRSVESEGGNGEIIDDGGSGESEGLSPNALVETADEKLIVLSSSMPHCPDICFYVDVLCLLPPPDSSKPLPLLTRRGIEPWRAKRPRFPSDKPDDFAADMVFSFDGHAFWADLVQGVLCCSCDDVLSGGYNVEFRYVVLPPECRLDAICAMGVQQQRYRTMSRVGDTIQFVSIGDGLHREFTASTTLVVWALVPATGEWKWKKLHELTMATLWGLDGFKNAGLPEVMPIHPILSTKQDGVMYMVLSAHDLAFAGREDCGTASESKGWDSDVGDEGGGDDGDEEEDDVLVDEERQYLIGLDICNESLLSWRRLPGSGYLDRPDLMGFDVSKCLDEHCLRPLADAAPNTDEAGVLTVPATRKRKLPSSPNSRSLVEVHSVPPI
uniref:DUF1618 domain-containing protein n=1 Tax=Oryza meridionalis TaxID=40149 RepID=A0A0E0DPD3_9ORYZ